MSMHLCEVLNHKKWPQVAKHIRLASRGVQHLRPGHVLDHVKELDPMLECAILQCLCRRGKTQ